MAFRGIDVRETIDRLLFRALLQDSDGALLTSGTTTLKLYELQDDGTLESYDFNDNTFKTGALTTETLAMTHRQGNNSTTNTGLWTANLTTLTGFTPGNIYFAMVNNTGAFPVDQQREFQFGKPLEANFNSSIVYVNSGGTNSTAWPYGTATYPTSTIANGKTIADANSLHHLELEGGLTFAAAMENYTFRICSHLDVSTLIDLNGQSVEHSAFIGGVITGAMGNAVGVGNATTFNMSVAYIMTDINAMLDNCRIGGACSVLDGGWACFNNCHFSDPTACTLTLNAPDECHIIDLEGELTLAGMDGGTCDISMGLGATLTIDNTCTAGTINITGDGTINDNSDGTAVNITRIETNVVKVAGASVSGVDDFKATGFAPAGEYNTEMARLDVDVSSRSDGTGVTLTAAYDAAKTAAQAGAQMDLVDAPNGTAITAIQSGLATTGNQTTIINHLTDIKGGTWASETDSLEAIRNRGDTAWITGGDATEANISAVGAAVVALNNLSSAEAQAAAAAALAAFDAATAANQTTILASITALNDPTLAAIVAGVWANANRTLSGTIANFDAAADLDGYVDTTNAAQWQHVQKLSGAGVEVRRKDLKDENGDPVTTSTQVVARHDEPSS